MGTKWAAARSCDLRHLPDGQPCKRGHSPQSTEFKFRSPFTSGRQCHSRAAIRTPVLILAYGERTPALYTMPTPCGVGW
jgi:hypothetical protein